MFVNFVSKPKRINFSCKVSFTALIGLWIVERTLYYYLQLEFPIGIPLRGIANKEVI